MEKTHSIKIGKASENDILLTINYLSIMEALWDSRPNYSIEESWENDLDDDDPLKIQIKVIRKSLAIEEDCSENDIDNRLIIYELAKMEYRKIDLHWRRVVMASSSLIDSVCDPNLSYLALHPFIERAVEKSFLGDE
jgi:hypothetical protein